MHQPPAHMNSLALAESSPQAYDVEFWSSASLKLLRMPARIVIKIRQRLREIAEVAAVAGGLGFVIVDGVGSTLHIEIDGYEVSYLVSDVHRLLTVLSIVATGA
jgi:hypothetical protein